MLTRTGLTRTRTRTRPSRTRTTTRTRHAMTRTRTRIDKLINSGNNNLLYMILKPKYLEPEVEVGIRN